MKTTLFSMLFSLLLFNLSAQTPEEFTQRRKEVSSRMEPNSVLIIRTPGQSAMFDYGRQGGYFYYLTGLDEPGCTLVIYSDSFRPQAGSYSGEKELLFIAPVNSDRINWDAQTPGLEGARAASGIKDVRPNPLAREYIGRLLARDLSAVYLDEAKGSSIIDPLTDDEQLIKSAREHGASFSVISPSKILNTMVSCKSDSEIGLMRRVVNITAEAQREAMRSLKPGMYEYQLDAIIKYVFTINGSGSVSFPTIVGSGLNSVVLHWMKNSEKMEDGDVVVVDCGAENHMYCADITRTLPVSGRFSARQKAIYEIVLKANEEAIKAVGPGVRVAVVSARADSVLADGMVRVGLIKNKTDFKKYYYHGLSHQIGLLNAFGGIPDVLQPGMIITIEPGIYVREERTGVRIEDDVLVTPEGYEVLSKNAPKQVAEIERLMKDEGTDVARNLVSSPTP